MPSLTLPDRLIWFAHCPKAGGTSVEKFMVARFDSAVGHLHWGWDLWWKKGGWRAPGPPCSPQHLIWEDALSQLPRAPDAVFAVVRDPVTRMVSEYRFQREKRRGTRLGRALAHLPFSIWLRVMLGLAARNPYAFDNHLRPQADFIPEGAQVFHLEDGLAVVGDWIAQQTGTTPPQDFTQHLRAAPQGRPIAPTPRDRALIARAFALDYARFGYRTQESHSRNARVNFPGFISSIPLYLISFLERCGKL